MKQNVVIDPSREGNPLGVDRLRAKHQRAGNRLGLILRFRLHCLEFQELGPSRDPFPARFPLGDVVERSARTDIVSAARDRPEHLSPKLHPGEVIPIQVAFEKRGIGLNDVIGNGGNLLDVARLRIFLGEGEIPWFRLRVSRPFLLDDHLDILRRIELVEDPLERFLGECDPYRRRC